MLADDFIDIYKRKIWGGGSGSGSSVDVLPQYLDLLRSFIRRRNVQTIVDVGCGDWQHMGAVPLDGITYLGVDVVPDLVATNNERFSSRSVSFRNCDFTGSELPPADLMICKDVLQHLTNAEILSGLCQLSRFKFALLTNDLGSNCRTEMPYRYAPLNLLEPPFNLRGRVVCQWRVDGRLKQTVLIEEPAFDRLRLRYPRSG